jgi:hypothetical protein
MWCAPGAANAAAPVAISTEQPVMRTRFRVELNQQTGRFDRGTAPLIIRAIDLDQCDRIAIRLAYKREGILVKTEEVVVSDETKAEKTRVEILRDAFEGMQGRQPKSDRELNEWLATDEGKLATMFEPTLMSRWGETGHA